jgi:hypothetical protein
MTIPVSSIEQAREIASEFTSAYSDFRKKFAENKKALYDIAIREQRYADNATRPALARQAQRRADIAFSRGGPNRDYFWQETVGRVAKKYHVSDLSVEGPLVGFDIPNIGYAELNLEKPDKIYVPKYVEVPIKWSLGLLKTQKIQFESLVKL